MRLTISFLVDMVLKNAANSSLSRAASPSVFTSWGIQKAKTCHMYTSKIKFDLLMCCVLFQSWHMFLFCNLIGIWRFCYNSNRLRGQIKVTWKQRDLTIRPSWMKRINCEHHQDLFTYCLLVENVDIPSVSLTLNFFFTCAGLIFTFKASTNRWISLSPKEPSLFLSNFSNASTSHVNDCQRK